MSTTLDQQTSLLPRAATPDITRLANSIHWTLRLTILLCFIGHGAFGIITKEEWLPFFRSVGIPDNLGWQLMPLIGTMDIAIGIISFLRPMRAVLIWATFWCTLTALMRPVAGMSWFEFIERAGNYGVPILLLISTYTHKAGLPGWFAALRPRPLDATLIKRLTLVATIATSLLLLGHAGFGFFLAKQSLAAHYQSIGLPVGDNLHLVRFIGLAELLLAIAVLFLPFKILFIGVALWKLLTELLYPIAGSPAWETVERAGSYLIPVIIVMLLLAHQSTPDTPAEAPPPPIN